MFSLFLVILDLWMCYVVPPNLIHYHILQEAGQDFLFFRDLWPPAKPVK